MPRQIEPINDGVRMNLCGILVLCRRAWQFDLMSVDLRGLRRVVANKA